MIKKTVVAILSSAMLTIALTGCAVTPAAPAAAPAAEPAAQETEASDAEWKPDKPIKIIVGMKEGGGIDTMARTMAPGISEYFGVDVVVENMPGSSSGIAADYIVEQPADGYTIFACSSSICGFATTENSDVTYKNLEVLAMPFTTHNPAVLVLIGYV